MLLKFRLLLIFSILIFIMLPIYSEAIKIASWNILNFPGSTGTSREDDFREVVDKLNLDILVVQEILSYDGVNRFLNNIMNHPSLGIYEAAPFFDGPDTDNALFYKKSSIKIIYHQQIPTDLRDISEYVLETKEGPSKGTRFRIYSVHLKSGTSSSDEIRREYEARILRNYLNNLLPNSLFLVCGDFNMQSSEEEAFRILTENQLDNDGRVKDPINRLGNWHDNELFSDIHTQSTRTKQFGGGATGGLDDRFDLFLLSYSFDESKELIFKTESYVAYGNDGEHLNKAINEGINKVVSSDIANALHEASDHLPIIIELESSTIARHIISIISGAGGTTDPAPGTYTHDYGTEVIIRAIPDKYYRFIGWTGDVAAGHENDNPLVIAIDSDKSVIANFLRIIYSPLQFSGQKVLNRSLSQVEYIIMLTWQANPNNVNIVKYRIYQIVGAGKSLLVELDANTFKYMHRRVERDTKYTYVIFAVNNENREGYASYINVQ